MAENQALLPTAMHAWPTPTLQGPRVRLEPMTMAHQPALERIAFDHRIWRYMIAWIETSDDLRRWMESALERHAGGIDLPWVTLLREHECVVGSTRLLEIDLYHGTAELGHTWLALEYQGTGVNTEAKLLQLRFAFEELGLARVALRTHHENLRSQAAIRKLGAQFEGTLRNQFRMPDGARRHSHYFSITAEEWPQVRSSLERQVESSQRDRSSPPCV